MKTTLDRFMEKVEIIPISGCWIWMGATDQHGYGCMTVNWKNVRAHRFSLSVLGGVDLETEKLDALHRCDTPSCVNPNHLFAGTAQVNVDDMWSKGRNRNRPMQDFCKRGHELTGDNVYVWSSGKGRSCRQCNNERAREYTAAKPKYDPKPLAKFCGKGHEFTEANTYYPKRGGRQCKECMREIGRRHDMKRRQKPEIQNG